MSEADLTPSILETSSEAFVSIGSDGLIHAWNGAAAETFGWQKEEVIGLPVAELIVPERYRDSLAAGIRCFTTTSEGNFLHRRQEGSALRKDGSEFPVEFTVSPIEMPDGVGFGAFVRDVTERNAAARDHELLATIVESSPDAIVSGTPGGRILSWNRGAEALYGYSAEETIGQPIGYLLPDESQTGVSAVRDRVMAELPVDEVRTKVRRKDGEIIDVAVSVSALRDESGKIIGLSSIARDITEREAARRTLHELRGQMAGAFENAPIGMAIVAVDGRFVAVNHNLCELLQRPAEEIVGGDFQTITHPDDLEADLRHLDRVLAGEVSAYEMEKRYLLPDGGLVWGQLCVSLVRDEDGHPLHFISQINDITARKEAEAELRRRAERLDDLALKDPLTGLTNQREFCTILEREVERAHRYGHELSLLVFDVDGFGEINAELGRAKGDELLRAIAATVAGVPRLPDLAARVENDEFALLLPHTDKSGACTLAERIREELALPDGLGLSVSVGVAGLLDGSDDTADHVLVRAEASLRAAKPSATAAASSRDGALRPRARQRIERILALVLHQLEMDLAVLGEFVGGQQVYRALEGDLESFGVAEGEKIPLAETFCHQLVSDRTDGIIPDARTDPAVRDLPAAVDGTVGSYAGVPIRLSNGVLFGTLCGLSHTSKPELGARDSELLSFLGEVVATILEQDELEVSERQAAVELSGVHALVAALEARDEYTGEHSRTVVGLAVEVSELLGLSAAQALEVEQVAILHDIGKVGIPDSVLGKPGPLSDDEWALMRQHPAIGERVIAGTQSLAHLAPAVRAEHERFDGDGYPDGLRGAAIPIASRITLACDAYHAMRSDRPYRAAMSLEAAREELLRGSGSQFDPNVVEALVGVIDRTGGAMGDASPAEAGLRR